MKFKLTPNHLLIAGSFLFALTMAPSISLGYISAGILGIGFVWWCVANRWHPRREDLPLHIFFGFYVLWGLVSSLFGEGVARSLNYWRADFLCLIFWLLYNTFRIEPKARYWALIGFTASIAFLAASGFAQMAIYEWFPGVNDWLKNSSQRWIRKLALMPEQGRRIHSTMHTLTYAETLALGGLFLVGAWRSRRLLGVGLGIAALAAVLVSESRGPTMSFFVGLLAIAAGYMTFSKKVAWRILLPFAIPCLLLFLSPSVWGRLKSTFNPDSNQDRIIMWKVALRVLEDHPVAGVGIAHIRTVWPDYFHQEWKEHFPHRQEIWSDVHSLYLQQAGERGWPGLIVLLALFAALIVSAAVHLSKDADRRDLHIATLAAMTAFLVMNITESAFQDTEIVFTLYLILAFAWSAAARRPDPAIR